MQKNDFNVHKLFQGPRKTYMFNQVKNVGLLGYEKRLRSVLNFIFCQSDAKLKYHMIKI